ncbi:hypothetical protein GH714_015282 [Hevea brasiliensis]|uniref:Uncharacterized protein n=1 Tax=Hevea brasiliensis TaxID=3981 RepID=A0A6A6NHD7_HEVBR|nr:hypothetical protein GH714_015282 [Hevea brasiliensis]
MGLQSARQTAAGRALWRHVIHDPLADLLAGETYLKNFHEKIKNDCLKNAQDISGVLLAIRNLWFDSKLETALNSFNGEAQVALLGAGFSHVKLSQTGDPDAHFGLLDNLLNLFNTLRILPRSMQTHPKRKTLLSLALGTGFQCAQSRERVI